MKNLSSLFYVIASLLFTSCSDEPTDSNTDQQGHLAIYTENVCCENLQLLNQVDFPEDCQLPVGYSRLLASNLNDFNIPDRFNFGDTLLIQFEFMGLCEAQDDQFDCTVVCDRLNGVPIRLTDIK